MEASSIASLDQSALALNILSEVIKTLKDLNLTTTESGKLQEPIQRLITFLITRAVDEMEKDEDARMTPTNFDVANDTKMAKYKKEIIKLIPKQTITTNNNTNMEPSRDEKSTTKKCKRSQSNNTTNEDEDEEDQSCGRMCSLLVTSIQDEKDLAFLGMIQQIQNNMATKESTSTKVRSKWENWTKTSKST